MTWNHERFVNAATKHKYTFACTTKEFATRFGDLSKAAKAQQAEAVKLAVVCKDGIIRVR